MLSLPDKLAADFKNLCSMAPTAVARALSDMEGNTGATWLATDNSRLVFFTRKPGSNDFQMLPYFFADASELRIDDDGKFSFLEITFPDREVHLKFSMMEQMTLAKIESNWTPITRQDDLRAPTELTPMLTFLVALQALVQADSELASQELGWIRENQIDTNALRRAGAWLRDHSLEELGKVIKETFDEAQKTCLHANLIALAMADGAYRSKEAEVIDKLRAAMDLSDEHHQQMFDLLLARNNITVFLDDDGEHLAPEALSLCCACLLAMCEYDGARHEREEKMVAKLINRNEMINAARTYLDQLGLKGIIDYLPGPLNDAQKRFILLNLLWVASANGVFDSHKQDLLDRFRRAMQMDEAAFQRDLKLHLTQQNLAVFAPAKKEEPKAMSK
jgi:tellurite resistance protein